MNVLVVGAGSVGQLFGYCLHRGGANVSFYVRPKYVEETRQGFTLYPLNERGGRTKPVRLEGCGVLSTPDELEATDWNQVYICIPSTGLYGGWFPDFAARLGPETAIVSLTPGIEDRAYILESWDKARLVIGMIASIAYPAPLPGEEVPEPGTAFYFPPLAKSPFEGPRDKVDEAVALLKKGGMPATRDDRLSEKAGYPNIVLMSIIAKLEVCGWSFAEFGKMENLRHAHKAFKEGLVLVSKRQGTRPPLPFRMVTPMMLKTALTIAPTMMPFDLETYLEVHFTKVGAQTRMFFEKSLKAADELSVEVPHLAEIARAI